MKTLDGEEFPPDHREARIEIKPGSQENTFDSATHASALRLSGAKDFSLPSQGLHMAIFIASG